MQITREHYNQLAENFKLTRNMMTDADCEEMRNKLNEMRKQLAFQACVKDWKDGKTINCGDFLIICGEVGVEVPETTHKWISADLIEVGCNSYSCIGKISLKKENILLKLCLELSSRI
jgi:hypothetical protein